MVRRPGLATPLLLLEFKMPALFDGVSPGLATPLLLLE